MSNKEEVRAAELLDEYADALEAGRRPNPDDFLRRCPQSERQGLELAMEGAKFLFENWDELLAPPRLVDRVQEQIAALRERQHKVEAAKRWLSETSLQAKGTDVLDWMQAWLGVCGSRQANLSRQSTRWRSQRNADLWWRRCRLRRATAAY